MQQLYDVLEAQAGKPIGLVVVIGAGDGQSLDIARLVALAPRRLVLVEGDPESAAELQRRAAWAGDAVVRATPVAPQSGKIRWCRYNLQAFNGPLNVEPLRTHYPRLRLVEERHLHATALADLLASVGHGAKADELNVLALDLPGQGDALLAAVPDDQLMVFERLLLRGCRDALSADAAAADQASQGLQQRFYRKVLFDDQTEPLWPVTVLSFDEQRYRAALLERQFAATQAARQGAEARVAELEAAHVHHASALQQAGDLHDQASKQWRLQLQERDRQLQQLQGQLQALQAEQSAASRAHAAVVSAHSSEVQTLHGQHQEREAQCDQQLRALGEQRDQLARDAEQRQAGMEVLAAARAHADSQVAQQARLIEQVTNARDEQARQTHGLQALVQSAELALHAAAQGAKTAQTALESRCQVAEARAEAARQQCSQLDAQVRQLQAERANQALRQQQLQDELQRAEGQIELVKDLLLGETGL